MYWSFRSGETLEEVRCTSTGEVGSSRTSDKQCVPGEDAALDQECLAVRRMAPRVKDSHCRVSQLDCVTAGEPPSRVLHLRGGMRE